MNFIGHAHVALWTSGDPGFVLGSMLPDFVAMARVRLSAAELVGDGAVARGIALHHRTDEVFHACTPFLELMSETMDALVALGVPRGSARAVGHVGVEMLIDGELVHDPEVRRIYPEALASASALEPNAFRKGEDHMRFRAVHERLCSHGVPLDYGDADAVTSRLARALSGRPRLELDASSERIVRTVLRDAQKAVVARVPELLECLHGPLAQGADR